MLKSVENEENKADIFLSPYEHHSNILPWIEFYDTVKVLEFNPDDDALDMAKIETQLINCHKDHLIVTVSAASNVTSQVTDLYSLNKVISNYLLMSRESKGVQERNLRSRLCCLLLSP